MSAVMPTYGRYGLSFERGEGAYLFATDGRRFLDFATGIAVNSLGHCHPHLVKAVQDQIHRLGLSVAPGIEINAQALKLIRAIAGAQAQLKASLA